MKSDNVKHILVADDSAVMRGFIAGELNAHGYATETASSGQEVFEKLRLKKFDLLILDLLMPHTSGLEVLAQIGTSGPPTIVLSADVQTATKNECRDLGAKAFLNKPPEKDLLLKTVVEVLGAAL